VQEAATKVAAKLLLDVARQVFAALVAHGREEGLEVLAHDDVERGLVGLATGVGARSGWRAGWGRDVDGSGRGVAWSVLSWPSSAVISLRTESMVTFLFRRVSCRKKPSAKSPGWVLPSA
jgi:hypothetical protein